MMNDQNKPRKVYKITDSVKAAQMMNYIFMHGRAYGDPDAIQMSRICALNAVSILPETIITYPRREAEAKKEQQS